MDRLTEDKVVAAIQRWASHHPEADEPVICIAGTGTYSPNQIAEEVGRRTPLGRLLLSVLDHGLEHAKLQEILDGFEGTRGRAAGVGA